MQFLILKHSTSYMAFMSSPDLMNVQGQHELETVEEHNPFKHVFHVPILGTTEELNLFRTILFRDWRGRKSLLRRFQWAITLHYYEER